MDEKKKLTPKQKAFATWTILFTIMGSIMVFTAIVSRHRQLEQMRKEKAQNEAQKEPTASGPESSNYQPE